MSLTHQVSGQSKGKGGLIAKTAYLRRNIPRQYGVRFSDKIYTLNICPLKKKYLLSGLSTLSTSSEQQASFRQNHV